MHGLRRLIFIALLSFSYANAQEEQSHMHVWFEGDVRHEAHLQPGLVAEFGPSSMRGASSGLQKLAGTTIVKRSPGATIYRLSPAAMQKMASLPTSQSARQSPVFRSSPQGGPLRALPGGVLVTFQGNLDEATARAWSQRHDVEFDRLLPLAQSTVVVLKSQPGVPSLTLANRVRLLPEVMSATPNWWTEKWKGPDLQKAQPGNATQLRSIREQTSRRFSD
ncbi:MAG: hypothetical protein NDI61_08305 [Bdellovibrionaceae bacterium]|nr:hypothetical protein [Pseudobdellovibrionaceae bacterium]